MLYLPYMCCVVLITVVSHLHNTEHRGAKLWVAHNIFLCGILGVVVLLLSLLLPTMLNHHHTTTTSNLFARGFASVLTPSEKTLISTTAMLLGCAGQICLCVVR